MAIFRYTFKKLLFSFSTWIILAITLVCLGVFWALISYNISKSSLAAAGSLYIFKSLTFGLFLSLLLFVFISIKTTQVFSDELSDGTLLILISKPITRNQIWLQKSLSLELTVTLYSFISIFISSLFILIPGIANFATFKLLFPSFLILFACSILFQIIISSIALLLSFTINAKALVAIVIIFGVIINIFSTIIEQIVVQTNENIGQYAELSKSVYQYQVLSKKLPKQLQESDWLRTYQYLDNKFGPNEVGDFMKDLTKVINEEQKESLNKIPIEKYENDYIDKLSKGELTKDKAFNNSKYGSKNGQPGNLNIKQSALLIYDVKKVIKKDPNSLLPSINAVFVDIRIIHNYYFDENDQQKKRFSKEEYKNFQSSITKLRLIRTFNIFYHFYYLWDNMSIGENPLYNPKVIYFNKLEGNKYEINLNKNTNDFVNYYAILGTYLSLASVLLAGSWWVFKRKDFA